MTAILTNMGNWTDYREAISRWVELIFPGNWDDAALDLALFAALVVVGVFAYLNRCTRRRHFSFWMLSWLFYGLWLASSLEPENTPLLNIAGVACLGISAVFIFSGSFDLMRRNRSQRELIASILLVSLWSYLAVYQLNDGQLAALSMFLLLVLAVLHAGVLVLCNAKRYRGALLLGTGFILWGALLVGFAFQRLLTPDQVALAHFCSAVLALLIAFAMLVQALEQARERNEALMGEFRKGLSTRRMLEQEINSSEQKYRALFDSASDAILVVDLQTFQILDANPSAEYFIGSKGPDGTYRLLLSICPHLRAVTDSLLENKRSVEDVFKPSNEFETVRPNGTHVLCEGNCSLVQNDKRAVLQVTLREITERKKLEQQLRQSEKLSALGQLIAGVAHELNNPLAVIMGYAQILTRQADVSAQTKLNNDIIKILRESERAAKIVRNLLTFARPREPQMAPVDLNRLLSEITEMHETDLQVAGIELRQHLGPQLPRTMADPHQIEQVLTNLVHNAIQAMSETQRTRVLELTSAIEGSTIRLTVADTGPGIPQEILGKIFDPFFTTKGPGKGTGLGLSISHSIIEEHRGRIWVETEPCSGSKFHVELPVVACPDESVRADEAVVAAAHDPYAAQYRVLVVDDEPGILEVFKAILDSRGYTVETANNGQEALERVSENHYDLIISDLCMAGVDGEALYRELRRRDPGLAERMIFVTGDTVSSRSRNFLDHSGNRWFSKPFDIAEIEEVVTNFLSPEPVEAH
jgi:PAS domain S-box-containing protein